MKKNWYLYLLVGGLFFTACKSDDDGEISQSEQNKLDDIAIEEYLKDHYFESERGKITAFDDDDTTDDAYPSLYSLGTKLNSGVWVIKRPSVEALGRSVVDNAKDSILISYHSNMFVANNGTEEDIKTYQPLGGYLSTINSSGSPQWDPGFYFTNIEALNLGNENLEHKHFEIEGFIEGLKEFKSTDNNGSSLYNFQGAVVVPSRLAFGRDFSYSGNQLSYSFRNRSFIFNIELHKVIDKRHIE